MNIQLALDDLMTVYAPDFAGTDSQEESQRRIDEHHGVLAYIADIKVAVKEMSDEK